MVFCGVFRNWERQIMFYVVGREWPAALGWAVAFPRRAFRVRSLSWVHAYKDVGRGTKQAAVPILYALQAVAPGLRWVPEAALRGS